MSQPSSLAPSQIFVARHGARLDAADASWHLTSPTPYDTPLTYGGWIQARSLGSRIGHLVTSHISSDHPLPTPAAPTKPVIERQGTWTAGPKKEKPLAGTVAGSAAGGGAVATAPTGLMVTEQAAGKLSKVKIVVHTSPFLRCVQTSIAAVAGMSQVFSDINVVKSSEDAGVAAGGKTSSKMTVHPRPILRIDGWLGEWLCEDYFTEITPPPANSLMIGTAKLDLMRPSSAGSLRKPAAAATSTTTPTANPSSTLSPSSASRSHYHHHGRAHSVGFIPPVASSVVKKGDPIPRGHVSHAKEFCDVDYGYDSLRYGEGGEYGEEWGRMHKRVKIGFERIVKDYATGEVKPEMKGHHHGHHHGHGHSDQPAAKTFDDFKLKTEDSKSSSSSSEDDDVPETTILVFITHGAIANALIGAMTHQPVLMDMAICSMSMGILKPPLPPPSPNPSITSPLADMEIDPLSPISTTQPTTAFTPSTTTTSSSVFSLFSPSASITLNASSPLDVPSYDVRITANTDHLRTTATPTAPKPSNASGGGNISPVVSPPLRPRKQSLGGAFSMYNKAGKDAGSNLIGPAYLSGQPGYNNTTQGADGALPSLFTGGRSMGMVFGNPGTNTSSGGGGGGGTGLLGKPGVMGVRRTASAAAATKGLWTRPSVLEAHAGSSDEGAVTTDEESGEEKKDLKEKEKKIAAISTGAGDGAAQGTLGRRRDSRSGSVAAGATGAAAPGVGGAAPGSGAMWGAPAAASTGGGLWNAGANADRRRRWTVTNRGDQESGGPPPAGQ